MLELEQILEKLNSKVNWNDYDGLYNPLYYFVKLKKPAKMKINKYNKLVDRYHKLFIKLSRIEEKKAERRTKKRNDLFLEGEKYLLKNPSPYQEFENPFNKYGYFNDIDGYGAI